MMKYILMIAFIFSGGWAVAGTYEEELGYLRYALQFSDFNANQMSQFENPHFGDQMFRLSQNNAPWAGNYYAMKFGGAARRWQKGGVNFANPEKFHSMQDLFNLPMDQLNMLSPTEKFDVFMGLYDYPTTSHELYRRGPLRGTDVQKWEGFCNGIRCAGILTAEPKNPVEVINPDGLRITFQPADIKALLGVSYFYVEKYAQLGGPTQWGSAENQPNAAVFDLALRYFLGAKKKSFIVDTHLGSEIWNESVVGYHRQAQTKKLSSEEKVAYPWATAKMKVTGFIETLGEVNTQKSNGATRDIVSNGELLKKTPISYDLYIDAKGHAKDGRWNQLAGKRGIDFAWFGGGAGTDSQQWNGNSYLDFQKLQTLVKKSQVPACRLLLR